MPRREQPDNVGRLPDFIGVGPPRTATTWLHETLSGHVGLPQGIKETNFFRWQYRQGLEWYQALFRTCPPNLPIGEFSPNYFAAAEARERIAKHIPRCKIICTLRDPVERLYSNYRKMCEQAYFVGSFEESLVRRPDLLEWSRYSGHIRAWQSTFGKEQVLVLLHDDLKADPQGFLSRACSFIEIPEVRLDRSKPLRHRVNAVTNAPRSMRLALFARKIKDQLENHGALAVINLLKRPWLRRFLFEGGDSFPPLNPATEAKLRAVFRRDVEELEGLLRRDLRSWKQ